ncbi:MAG TPA: type II toxin-antitoxin system VapC family toxin [Sulfolobales archaeon]|jgi:predicted nucleic acid-binding protein|nr:type II toxin-antitoxin system VapC family toxin [Sulfolobales archaeon]
MAGAVKLSPRYGITVYDASYLSLAKHLNIVVYTTDDYITDKELLRKASGFKRAIHIRISFDQQGVSSKKAALCGTQHI